MSDVVTFVLLVLGLYLLEHPEAAGRWFGVFVRSMGFG